MAVSETMAVSKAALLTSGAAGISAQRGTQTWGANYTFSPSGLQNDVLNLADIVKDNATALVPNASGTYVIGTKALPVAASGLIMLNQGGTAMRLIITAGGLVSGVLA